MPEKHLGLPRINYIYAPFYGMYKIITIVFLLCSFFLEDIAGVFAFADYPVHCIGDISGNDVPESKEKSEDGKDEYKINSSHHFRRFVNPAKNRFHYYDENGYFEHCPEINSPPPDLV